MIMEHKHDSINTVKVKVKVTDLLFQDKPPLAFDSLTECAKYFGKSRSWLTQRFKRADSNTIEYAGCRIEVIG